MYFYVKLNKINIIYFIFCLITLNYKGPNDSDTSNHIYKIQSYDPQTRGDRPFISDIYDVKARDIDSFSSRIIGDFAKNLYGSSSDERSDLFW